MFSSENYHSRAAKQKHFGMKKLSRVFLERYGTSAFFINVLFTEDAALHAHQTKWWRVWYTVQYSTVQSKCKRIIIFMFFKGIDQWEKGWVESGRLKVVGSISLLQAIHAEIFNQIGAGPIL